VLDYLYTTEDLVMPFAAPVGELAFHIYSKTTNLGLHTYSDASFADAEDRKSTSGYLFKFVSTSRHQQSYSTKHRRLDSIETSCQLFARDGKIWIIINLEQSSGMQAEKRSIASVSEAALDELQEPLSS
jgi:hypothetical protein